MKRREFLEAISGTAITSTALRVMGVGAVGQLVAGCTTEADTATTSAGVTRPWMNAEPVRLQWARLSPQHASEDPDAVFERLLASDFNCLQNTAVEGGSYYPSDIPYNEPTDYLPEGGDFYGRIAERAKENGMRIGARFDFTQQSQAALDAHPEWFIRHKDGSPEIVEGGRFKPCLYSPFYPTQGMDIVLEVINKYDADFIYLNYFGNFVFNDQLCYCDSCEAKYQDMYGRSLPDEPDDDFLAFIDAETKNVAQVIADRIKPEHPDVLIIHSFGDDGHHLETRAGDWVYYSSEQINRQRTSHPERVGVDQWFSYEGDPAEFNPRRIDEMRVRYAQFGAHGSPIAFCSNGTVLNPSHGPELAEAATLNAWYKDNEDIFGLQENQARVLMMVMPETWPRIRDPLSDQTLKGIYAMLTEAHIPVAVSESPESLVDAAEKYDLVIVTQNAPMDGLQEYVEAGGRALFVSQEPPFGVPDMVEEVSNPGSGYVEIRDPGAFASVTDTRPIESSGTYMPIAHGVFDRGGEEPRVSNFYVYPEEEGASLTFVLPVADMPADLADVESTEIPALIERDIGEGRIAFFPWDIGGYYYRDGQPGHAGLFADVVDSLLGDARQIVSTAPASVEMVMMRQPQEERTVLHLINCSGKTEDGFEPPETFEAIELDVAGDYSSAVGRVSGADLAITSSNGRSVVTLPQLTTYEAIVLS